MNVELGTAYSYEYLSTDKDGNSYRAETVFWVDDQGKTFSSGPRPYSANLDNPDEAWFTVTKVHNKAAYIGRYPRPKRFI